MRLQRRCARMALSTSRWPPSLLERGKCSWVGIQSLNSSLTGSKWHAPPSSSGQKHSGILHASCVMYPCSAALMRIPLTPSAFNFAAAARPRSGSRSTLAMSQRYLLWDPQRWLGRYGCSLTERALSGAAVRPPWTNRSSDFADAPMHAGTSSRARAPEQAGDRRTLGHRHARGRDGCADPRRRHRAGFSSRAGSTRR
jgi:hypothetical protein